MTECFCRLIPIRELEAEIGRPLGGWDPEILTEDDLGRLSVHRDTARRLIEERRTAERKRLAEAEARRASAPVRPVRKGVSAAGVAPGTSAVEVMMGYDKK